MQSNVSFQPNDIAQYPEYNQRHIMELKEVSAWTENETKIQLKHNRMLQPGYIECSPTYLIKTAKVAGESWLTNIAPLTFHASLYLNICAELITFYQLELDECSVIASEMYHKLITDQELKYLEQKIKTECNDTAKNAYDFIKNAKRKKALTDAQLQEYLPDRMQSIATMLGIAKKPLFPTHMTHDICILGASGSGKSSIIRQIVTFNKLEYVGIATDDYRGFYLPRETAFENVEPDEQRFIRTQDTAYLIKELVNNRLSRCKLRPNVYIDAITLEDWEQTLLKSSPFLTSAIAGLSNMSQVPKRVYSRAEQSMHPADKKRHVNTSALLTSHGISSQRLLVNLPLESKTAMYDTFVPQHEKPLLMGIINNSGETPSIIVTNLSRFCNFMGKVNVNTDADFGGMLFFNQTLPKYQFTYDALYKAEQLLNLLKPDRYQPKTYELLIQSNDQPVCNIVYTHNAYHINIMDKALFQELLNHPEQKQPVEALLLIICYGNKVRNEVEVLGRKGALINAMKLLKVNASSTSISPRSRLSSTMLLAR